MFAKNGLRAMVRNNEVPLGMQCFTADPALIEVLGLTGFDFVMIDSEHSGNNPRALEQAIRVADGVGLVSLVRVSEHSNGGDIHRALEAGAQGYILKSTNPDQFIRALETILTGGLYAPASLSFSPIHPPVPAQRMEPAASPVLTHLTERQRDVFGLLAEGCATKTIARRLDLAVGTVKVHLAAIYRTLGASSRLEALAKAHRAARA